CLCSVRYRRMPWQRSTGAEERHRPAICSVRIGTYAAWYSRPPNSREETWEMDVLNETAVGEPFAAAPSLGGTPGVREGTEIPAISRLNMPDSLSRAAGDKPVQTSRQRELDVLDGKDVTRREVAWLWPGRIPLGKVTLLIGDPGAGKSYLT